MTRHTRNRPLKQIRSLMSSKYTGNNISIKLSRELVWDDVLDPTFKWTRVRRARLVNKPSGRVAIYMREVNMIQFHGSVTENEHFVQYAVIRKPHSWKTYYFGKGVRDDKTYKE
ncbi:hypothetical protein AARONPHADGERS_10 [Bacillus phage AaronPhadgers]|nr:hypothetical protein AARONPHADGERS_10 [Bacillus phage AaronPhadgers]